MTEAIKAHQHDPMLRGFVPHWLTPEETRGNLSRCSYCGSLHPATLAKSIRDGAKLEGAVQKYGWPHKWYATGGQADWAKFYTTHLLDAAPADLETIQHAMGLVFAFDEVGGVKWERIKAPA